MYCRPVGIPEVGALRPRDKSGGAPDGAKSPHRRIDSAGNGAFAGTLEQLQIAVSVWCHVRAYRIRGKAWALVFGKRFAFGVGLSPEQAVGYHVAHAGAKATESRQRSR